MIKNKPLNFIRMYEVADILPISAYFEYVEQFTHKLEEIGFYGDKNYLWFHKKGLGGAFYEENEVKKSTEVAYKIFTNKDRFTEFMKGATQAIDDIKLFSAQMKSTDFENSSLENLSKWEFKRREQEINIFTYYLATQPQNLDIVEQQLQKEVELVVKNSVEVNEVIGLLIADEQISKSGEEELSWLNIVLKDKKGKAVDKDIERHFLKYKYLMICEKEWDPKIDLLQKKLRSDHSLSVEEIMLKIKDLERYSAELRQKKKFIIQKYDISEDAIYLSNILSQIGRIRFQMRIEGFMPFFQSGIYLTIEVAKKLCLSREELFYCTPDEFKLLLKGKSAVSKNELKKRASAGVYLLAIEDKKARFFFGDDAEKEFLRLVPKKEVIDLDMVRGMMAMPGKVEGTAFVFSWDDNLEKALEKLPEDAILIAGQTRPQIVLLIRRCRGIITDEGGTMSHAAIIAREFKVPCIVGTGNATKVFRSGQKITLDATSGVASIRKE